MAYRALHLSLAAQIAHTPSESHGLAAFKNGSHLASAHLNLTTYIA